MPTSQAIINICDLRLRTFIGFNPEEQSKMQDIVINAEIHYPANKARDSDLIDQALNYKDVTKAIIELVEHGRFMLLEKLVDDILQLCHQHPWVTFTKVRVDKPHALRFADSVALTLSWQRE
ncbi:dihydroneopterin triphosphate 2'-epimerase [Motilimonas pumila]|uniref:Dihydroneopterin triphosphate 2'-epimerase n=1 Tax=Motilimonas pumila TaxID=2303987 RepID=A0A418YEH1_9GAMM|nr:dihydroneopterin triphosphate 2'-epimerase [Motilimonas pumila]RJG47472.1 dihydroneopterin triphosphate 2'-epimerase [Motilimonas pumila]